MSYNLLTVAQNIVANIWPLLIVVGAVVVPIMLVWLIIRPLRLWYWKIDKRSDALDTISTKVCGIENHLDMQKNSKQGEAEVKERKVAKNSAKLESQEIKESKKSETIKTKEDTKEDTETCSKEIVENEQNYRDNVYSRNRNIDRNGNIYKREELEAQIKF